MVLNSFVTNLLIKSFNEILKIGPKTPKIQGKQSDCFLQNDGKFNFDIHIYKKFENLTEKSKDMGGKCEKYKNRQ